MKPADEFDRIRGEQGRLDLLVNNAWSGYEISPDPSLAFWEIEWRHWDLMFTGGLRAAAYASRLAAPMMIAAGQGLIVNMIWVLDRPHGHAFYEVVKNATNKLTEQMADDLRPHGVACVAVSPGFMRLERMNLTPEIAVTTESAQFPGRAVSALAADQCWYHRCRLGCDLGPATSVQYRVSQGMNRAFPI